MVEVLQLTPCKVHACPDSTGPSSEVCETATPLDGKTGIQLLLSSSITVKHVRLQGSKHWLPTQRHSLHLRMNIGMVDQETDRSSRRPLKLQQALERRGLYSVFQSSRSVESTRSSLCHCYASPSYEVKFRNRGGRFDPLFPTKRPSLGCLHPSR